MVMLHDADHPSTSNSLYQHHMLLPSPLGVCQCGEAQILVVWRHNRLCWRAIHPRTQLMTHHWLVPKRVTCPRKYATSFVGMHASCHVELCHPYLHDSTRCSKLMRCGSLQGILIPWPTISAAAPAFQPSHRCRGCSGQGQCDTCGGVDQELQVPPGGRAQPRKRGGAGRSCVWGWRFDPGPQGKRADLPRRLDHAAGVHML